MTWKHLPIVAFDVETTGLSPFTGDRIIEVGLVEIHLDDSGSVAERIDHSFLINPGIPIPREVVDLTGISDADVADKPPFEEVAKKVHEVLSGAITIAHNYMFDLAFLSQELERVDLHWPEPMAEIDTLALSRICFPTEKSHRLGELSKRLNVNLKMAHRATDDAAACGYCFLELVGRHSVKDDLQAMLDWSQSIGRPPENDLFEVNDVGSLVFHQGPHVGDPVALHPLYLAWLEKARVRRSGGWEWLHTDRVRAWIRRWLEVRGAAGPGGKAKGFGRSDWVIDSHIASAVRVAEQGSIQ